MLSFSFLDKSEKEIWLPKLFDLLYGNMRHIAPSGLAYEQETAQWLTNVSSALEKAPRQIILCFVDDNLAGFIMYYIRDKLLMVEEVQVKKAYQGTFVFYRLCQHLIRRLPENIETIEAYAEKRNSKSQKLMQKLGMEIVDDAEASPFVHLRGSAQKVKVFFAKG